MNRHSYEIEFHTDTLLTLEAFLAKVHTAARAGHLDWGACDLAVKLEFFSYDTENFAPLEAFIKSQDRIDGVSMNVERSNATVNPPKLPRIEGQS
jgi:hypothetical protein